MRMQWGLHCHHLPSRVSLRSPSFFLSFLFTSLWSPSPSDSTRPARLVLAPSSPFALSLLQPASSSPPLSNLSSSPLLSRLPLLIGSLSPPSTMGGTSLNPSCFTSDGTYIYTHALVTTSDMGTNTNVLAKSNASPASIADVTWTLVSAVALGGHYLLTGLPMEGTFVCTVDSTGVFTVLDATSRYGVTDETPVMARGLQYTPGAGGAVGTWTNIDVSAGYKWNLLSHSALFPLGGTLMQIYGTGIVTNTLTVSIFDKTNNTFMQQSSPYTLVCEAGFFFFSSRVEKKETLTVLLSAFHPFVLFRILQSSTTPWTLHSTTPTATYLLYGLEVIPPTS